jgi:peptidoglycan/LPS O-acetylase OafA/YrhL
MQDRIVILDFYRFLAAYGVAVYHISEFSGRTISFTQDFGIFVDFFFVLSGFVIGRNYFETASTPAEILRFIQKRFARIYPLYFVTLLAFVSIYLAGFSTHPENYKTSSIIAQLLMVQQWQLNPPLPLNFPAWSISAEWAMYLLFPMLALIGRKIGNAFLLIVAGASAVCIWVLLERGVVHAPFFTALKALPTFTIGVAISQMQLKIRSGAVVGAAVFGASIALMTLHAPMVLIIAMLIGTVALTAADPFPAQTPAVLGILGDLSYSIYMIHALCYSIAYKLLAAKVAPDKPVVFGVIISVCVVLFSFPVFYLFENPARRFLSKTKWPAFGMQAS